MDKNQKDIIQFFIENPEFFFDLISTFYPLNQRLLNDYKSNWYWENISCNENIKWDSNIIESIKANVDWSIFTTNPSAFKDLSLLDKFDHLIKWEEECYHGTIANNKGITWNSELIDRYKEKIDFTQLSQSTHVEWSENLIKLYKDKWDFLELAMNNSFPWTISLFEKYLDTSMFSYFNVKINPRFISNVSFIEKYSDFLDWTFIFANPELPWVQMDLLNRWKEHIQWFGVARNPFFFQNDPDFFYKNLQHWKDLSPNYPKPISQNTALPWGITFIEKYQYLWDWKYISMNESIPWSKKLIDKFLNQLEWGGVSPCPLVDEEGNFVSEFGGLQYNHGLVTNESLPWSLDFINYYRKYIDFESLSENKGVWEKAFKPFVNDEIVEITLKIL